MPGIRNSTQWSLPQVSCADELGSHGHRIISILRQVNPSERVVSSAQVVREVTWETGFFCSKVLHQFSCKPFYRNKSLAVFLQE